MDPVDIQARLAAAAELRDQGQEDAANFAEFGANPELLWTHVVRAVQQRVTPTELDNFLLSSRGVEISDNLLVVAVPSGDVKEWLLDRFGDEFRSILAAMSLPEYNLSFRVEEETRPELAAAPGEKPLPHIHIARALDRWKTELLDLSKSNQLLYGRLGRSMLELTHPGPDALFDDLVNSMRTFQVYRTEEDEGTGRDEGLELVLEEQQFSDHDTAQEAPQRPAPRPPRKNEVVIPGEPKKVEGALYRLRLKARSALQEQGVSVLFCAFGLLEWQEARAGSGTVFSPLVLVPVRLERETALSPYTLIPLEEEPVFNPALARKMSVEYGIRLELPQLDEKEDLKLEKVLEAVRKAIKGEPEWKVRSQAFIGLFSFAKQALYADLEGNFARFLRHPILRSLSGEVLGVPPMLDTVPSAEEMDRSLAPSEVFQVLDADATQQEAIAAVNAGANVVIQGPPGTGKSQTITNIISEFLAQGKKVLFVSEKRAALQVVAKRLEQAGLLEFCLEAHSQDLQKQRVIHDLERVLRAGRGNEDSLAARRTETDLTRLLELRRELNAYVDALHDAQNPLGMSAYHIHGELAALSAPYVPMRLSEPEKLTVEDLTALRKAVQRLMEVGHVLLAGQGHPWWGCTIRDYSPQLRSELGDQLEKLEAHASTLDQLQAAIRAHMGLNDGNSLDDARWLAALLPLLDQYPGVPSSWLEVSSVEPLLVSAREHRELLQDYHSRRDALLARYDAQLFDLDLKAVAGEFGAETEDQWAWVRGSEAARTRAALSEQTVGRAVEEVRQRLSELTAIRDRLVAATGLSVPDHLAGGDWLASIATIAASDPRPTARWFEPGELSELRELALGAKAHQETVLANAPTVDSRFNADFYQFATPALLESLETEYGSWLRKLKSGYRQVAGRAKSMLTAGGDLPYADLKEYVRTAVRVTASRQWLAEHKEELRDAFGFHYQGLETDWDLTVDALDAFQRMDRLLQVQEMPTRLRNLLLGLDGGPRLIAPLLERLDRSLGETRAALRALDGCVDTDTLLRALDPSGALSLESVPLEHLAVELERWSEKLHGLWRSRAMMASCSTGGDLAVEQLAADSHEALSLREVEEAIESSSERLRGSFGELFEGMETDWDQVLDRLGWTAELLRHFGTQPPAAFVERLVNGSRVSPTDTATCITRVANARRLLSELAPYFGSHARVPAESGDDQFSVNDIAIWAQEKHRNLPRLEEWSDLLAALERANSAHLTEFVDSLITDRPPIDTWLSALMRQVYTQWLTWRYSQSEALSRFRGDDHERKRAEFQELDMRQWKAASARIAQRVRRKRPLIAMNLPRQSEVAILLREASKRKRFRPLRQLFADLPNILLALKPCLLMSPLAVSQYLGESPAEFDLVIFDEASQILPADAIGAIGRARQLVVVGDQKQLPPTRFFAVNLQSGEEEDDEELPESILDTCLAAGMPQQQLLWHYRSRHEGLIAFSNRHFYDDRLVTFPSPNADEQAVHFIHVPGGQYSRGGQKVNKVEASRLVDAVIEHVRRTLDGSIGVITFSEPQMVAIQQEIDRRKRDDPSLETLLRESGPEGFFVKNLENVQGDERNVIFFSVGYGPDADGNMTMNFGPLNRQGGERRLNVAITRARYEVKIFASFHPDDIDMKKTKARGVQLLRDYLTFAVSGPESLQAEPAGDEDIPMASFEDVVAITLDEAGLQVRPQVGVGQQRVDIGVKSPGEDRYGAGILCDGTAYRMAKTARDRDRLRDQVLERLGWQIERTWSTDWIKDPSGHAERLLKAIQTHEDPASQEMGGNVRQVQEETATYDVGPDDWDEDDELESVVTPIGVPSMSAPPIGATYCRVELPANTSTPERLLSCPVWTLQDFAVQCIEVEGPVHVDRVVRAVAEVFSVRRVSHRTRPYLMKGISAALSKGLVEQRGNFLWPRGLGRPTIRAYDQNGETRPIQEVAPEEIQGAVLAVLEVSFAMPREDLAVSVARFLGYERLGAIVRTEVFAAIDALLDANAVVRTGDQIRAA